ncbi:MAG: MarR family transcriptional regulator [Promethearchaeota archaeon]
MLEKIFGKGLVIRILETFLKPELKGKWLNVREVARQSGVPAGSISRRISELVEIGTLLEENPSPHTRIFKLNENNAFIPALIKFFEEVKKIEDLK